MFKIGQRLKRIREELELTQKEFAERIGSTERGVRRYESGEREPAFRVILAIVNNLDVDANYLLGRTDEPSWGAHRLDSRDFLDDLILETRFEHDERLAKAGGKVDNPAIEYADLLLRRYHRALLFKLSEAGVKF